MDVSEQSVALVCEHDIVIDTNVFVHSHNTDVDYHKSALLIMTWMANSSVTLVLDDTGKLQPDYATSHLFSEYRRHIGEGTLPWIVLEGLLEAGRVIFVDRPPHDLSRELKEKFPSNKVDRVVAGAACMSQDKTLVTNDWGDFTRDVRKWLKKAAKVDCLDSDGCLGEPTS